MTFNSFPIPTKAGFESLLLQKAQEVASSAQSAEQAATNAANDANAQIAPNVAAAQTAETGAVTAQGLAEAARDATLIAALEAGVFADTAAGLAGTSENDLFWVPEGDDAVLYRHDAGPVAFDTELRLPLSASLNDLRRTIGTITDSNLPFGSLAFYDEGGNVGAFLGPDAVLTAAGFAIPGGALLQSEDVDSDDLALTIHDADGNVAFGIRNDGEVLGGGGGASPSGPSNTVYAAWPEVWLDPSVDTTLTWWTDSDEATRVLYRPVGGTVWLEAVSHWTRPEPNETHGYLHTAYLPNLSRAARYEYLVPGSSWNRTFKTAPGKNLRIGHASDYQIYTFGAGSRIQVLGGHLAAQDPHLLIMGGDYINDDGIVNSTNSQRWRDFMAAVSQFYVNDAGDQIPLIALVGNHEGENFSGGGSASAGGNGRLGYMQDLFSFGFDPNHPTRFVNGAADFQIGSDTAVIMLETDHCEPLPGQFDWFAARLAYYHPRVRHIVVAGHACAFSPAVPIRYTITTQARELRNRFWPEMQKYADKVRVYMGAHAHVSAFSDPLAVDYDPGLTLEQNDNRWEVVAPDAGIRQTVALWGGSPRTLESVLGRESDLDSSRFKNTALGIDAGDLVTLGSPTNARADIFSLIILELSDAGAKCGSINLDGDPFWAWDDTV